MKLGPVHVMAAFPGFDKAWPDQQVQHDPPRGLSDQIKLVPFDGRNHSPTREEIIEVFPGPRNYRARVPRIQRDGDARVHRSECADRSVHE